MEESYWCKRPLWMRVSHGASQYKPESRPWKNKTSCTQRKTFDFRILFFSSSFGLFPSLESTANQLSLPNPVIHFSHKLTSRPLSLYKKKQTLLLALPPDLLVDTSSLLDIFSPSPTSIWPHVQDIVYTLSLCCLNLTSIQRLHHLGSWSLSRVDFKGGCSLGTTRMGQNPKDNFFVAGWHFTWVKFWTWVDRNSASVQVRVRRGEKRSSFIPTKWELQRHVPVKRLFLRVDLLVLGTMDFGIIYLRNTPFWCLFPVIPLTLKLSGESRCSFFFRSSDAPAHSL